MSQEAQQERLKLLGDFMDGQDVPKSYYSIGKYRDEAVCIEAENNGWIVYEGDRGGRYNEKHFDVFYEAGRYFLSRATYNQDHRAYLLSSFEKCWEKYERKQVSLLSPRTIPRRLFMPALLLSVSVILCLVIADVCFRIYLIYWAREEGVQLYLALNHTVLIIVLGLIIIILVHRFNGSRKSVVNPVFSYESVLNSGAGSYEAPPSRWGKIKIFIIIVIIVIIIASIFFFLHRTHEPSLPQIDPTVTPSPLPSITEQKQEYEELMEQISDV